MVLPIQWAASYCCDRLLLRVATDSSQHVNCHLGHTLEGAKSIQDATDLHMKGNPHTPIDGYANIKADIGDKRKPGCILHKYWGFIVYYMRWI